MFLSFKFKLYTLIFTINDSKRQNTFPDFIALENSHNFKSLRTLFNFSKCIGFIR